MLYIYIHGHVYIEIYIFKYLYIDNRYSFIHTYIYLQTHYTAENAMIILITPTGESSLSHSSSNCSFLPFCLSLLNSYLIFFFSFFDFTQGVWFSCSYFSFNMASVMWTMIVLKKSVEGMWQHSAHNCIKFIHKMKVNFWL